MDFNTAHTLRLVKGVYLAILKILRNRFCQFEFVTLYINIIDPKLNLTLTGNSTERCLASNIKTNDGHFPINTISKINKISFWIIE